MNKWRVGLIVSAVALSASGCGNYPVTGCWELTDGGPMGKHFAEYRAEDRRQSEDLVPQISRWYKQEKAKMPKFQRTCPTAEDFYYERVAADAKVAKNAAKEAAEREADDL